MVVILRLMGGRSIYRIGPEICPALYVIGGDESVERWR